MGRRTADASRVDGLLVRGQEQLTGMVKGWKAGGDRDDQMEARGLQSIPGSSQLVSQVLLLGFHCLGVIFLLLGVFKDV